VKDESLPADSRLINPDLAPVVPEQRTWTRWHIAALWVGMAVCIPTYTLAAGLINQGMSWWQALLCVLLGNLIVLVPMTLNAAPGTKYGIPFPVLLRSSFGTLGSNIPALMRGVVACGWFGIQTWVGGSAMYVAVSIIFGFDFSAKVPLPGLGISAGELICFLLFWLTNVLFIWFGIKSIKWLEVVSAPFLLAVAFVLLAWALSAANGFGPIFAQPSQFESFGQFLPVFAAGVTAMVGFWATLSLNIPDFSRYARSQKDQVLGQLMGLPATMTLYSFVGIMVTSATVVVFGEAIWDPVQLLERLPHNLLCLLALVVLAIATLSTNIAANVVSPANDFSNLAPRHISFRTGGMITAFLGIIIQPWRLYADPTGYIFVWLIGYSALLGPIAGIMIADYFLYRKQHLLVAELYRSEGKYSFTKGFSGVGLLALGLAVLPSVPGFLVAIRVLEPTGVPGFLTGLYNYAWFVGFLLGFSLYLGLRKMTAQQAGQ
jgi:NCS1 family nucleobase:cation symporter-1